MAGLGEFEHLVLLAILRAGDEASGPELARELERAIGRRVTRGALYSTLNRLEAKGLVRWTPEAPGPDRGGHIRRLFKATPSGVTAIRESRDALMTMWSGLERTLGKRR
jgi:DNA-binding PadR family transcriptional regulator